MKQLIYLATILLAISCSKSQQAVENPKPEEQNPIVNYVPAKPIVLQAQSKLILDKTNTFAFGFFKALSQKQSENMFLSPYSMSAALGMLYNGAAGDTKKEIAGVLGMHEYEPQEINQYYKELTKALVEVDSHTILSIANSVWANKTIPLKSSFLDLNKNYFDAKVSTLDFSSPATVPAINLWCKEKTNGKIPEIIKQLDPSSMVLLTNAIYFSSFWRFNFDKTKTVNKSFNNIDNTSSSVAMMHQRRMDMMYSQMDRCGMVTIPYSNTAYAMNIILPAEGEKIDDIINELDQDVWKTMVNHRSLAKVTFSMPRFKIENSLEKLDETLSVMGMPTAFTHNADFSAMSDMRTYVSDVIQKSYISVDENGTEAAAVTIVNMYATSIGPQPNPAEVIMEVNRPFIFLINEQSTGAILFIGKVTNL
ncbi:MAG: serpin family protein [Bacteroidales bacterium]|nr:serpin family protein [Bacteroidales bacterium]